MRYLVTGGASGIWLATVRRLAGEGCELLAFDRDAPARAGIPGVTAVAGSVAGKAVCLCTASLAGAPMGGLGGGMLARLGGSPEGGRP